MEPTVHAPTSGLVLWLKELRRSWWMLPLVAGVLTLLKLDLDEPPRRLLINFVISLVITGSLGGTTTAIYALVIERFVTTERWWSWLARAAVIAVGVVLGTELALLLLSPWFNLRNPMEIRTGIWQVGAVVSAVLLSIALTRDRLTEKAERTQLRAERAQRELLRAQLDNLHARLNPHFLFNSLNTVAALIEEEPARAITAVERLSDLLRYSLEGTRRHAVPLQRELDALEAFLQIERLRYGERLQWSMDVDPEITTVEVPPLLLQPVVENAVRHGVAQRRDGGSVQVDAHRDGNRVRIVIYDDGPGASDEGGTHLGEATVRERLDLSYGERSSFEAGPAPEGGYRVDIALPIEVPACA